MGADPGLGQAQRQGKVEIRQQAVGLATSRIGRLTVE